MEILWKYTFSVNSAETQPKLCVSTKFQEISWNYGNYAVLYLFQENYHESGDYPSQQKYDSIQQKRHYMHVWNNYSSAKCSVLFINNFEIAPSNQTANINRSKPYKLIFCTEYFLNIPLLYPSHTTIACFKGKSKYAGDLYNDLFYRFSYLLHLRNLI